MLQEPPYWSSSVQQHHLLCPVGGVLGDNVLCQSFYKTKLTEIFNFHLLSKNLVINVGRSLSTPYYIYDKERPGNFMYLLL